MFYNSRYGDLCGDIWSTTYSDCVTQGTMPQAVLSFTFPGIGRHIVFMAGYGVFFLITLFAIELGLVRFLNFKKPVIQTKPGGSLLLWLKFRFVFGFFFFCSNNYIFLWFLI